MFFKRLTFEHLVMLSFLMIGYFELGDTRAVPKKVRRRRIRANVFDPSLPAYPSPNTPFYQPPPYPLATATMSPSSVLMPSPPKFMDSDNPFFDSMHDPINPNYGLGFAAVQPTILGGNVNFPVGNMLRPQESVGGTFGFARPINVRFGTQGGPFFPWQDRQYAKTIKDINQSQAALEAFKKDASLFNPPPQSNFEPSNQATDQNLPPPAMPAEIPGLPPPAAPATQFKPVLPPPIPMVRS